MNIKVFLIDDTDSPGKFEHFDAFIQYLSKQFSQVHFEIGTMFHKGKSKPVRSAFAKDALQVNNVLHDDSSLILLDITMESAPFVTSAERLLELHPERVARANAISSQLENGRPSDKTRLAGAVLAIAEMTLTRIALVTTESPGTITQNIEGIGVIWIPWNPAGWATHPTLAAKLQSLIEQQFMGSVRLFRQIWTAMALSAKQKRWIIAGKASTELFASGTYHSVCGHLEDAKTMNANSNALETATANLVDESSRRYLMSPAEQIAVLKSANRVNQIPIFLVQRILGLNETSDVSKALSWESSIGRDAAAMFKGLSAIKATNPAKIGLNCNDHVAHLFIELEGQPEKLRGAEEALRLGAARRSAIIGRNGNPGDLTLGVDLIAPDSQPTISKVAGKNKIIIMKSFNIEDL